MSITAAGGVAVGGEYAENSLIQQLAFEDELHSHAVEFIRRRLLTTNCPVIVDHGAADGLTTCKLLRELGDDVPFVACFQDLPSNDWDAASKTLATMKLGGGQLQPFDRLDGLLRSAAAGDERRSFVSVPGNFFEQVMPSGSVDLSLSGSAYHWLSSTDHLPRPGGICLELADFPGDMRDAWAAQARADWATILRRRAAELKVGGMLMAVVPCAPCNDGAVEMLTRVFAQFDRRGLLRPDAKVKNGFALPAYVYRNAQDLRAGFDGLPFRLDVCKVCPRRNPYLPKGGFADAVDRERFGRQMAGWCFGWGARLIEDAVGSDRVEAFRATLAELFAKHADADELRIGMGAGVVLAERINGAPQ